MRRRDALVMGLACLAAVWAGVGGTAAPVSLVPSSYSLFPVGAVQVDVQTLSEAAQGAGYAVLVHSGGAVSAYRGTELSVESVDALVASDHLLVLDGDRFYLHSVLGGLSYALRPAGGEYELVVASNEEVSPFEALAALVEELQGLGILGMAVDLEGVQTFSRGALKDPAVPGDVALDSTLYSLRVAEDWFAYARSKGLRLEGLRIEVVAEKATGEAFPAAFAAYVVSETDRLVKLLLPIDQMIPLAKQSAIGYVRLPLQPVVP